MLFKYIFIYHRIEECCKASRCQDIVIAINIRPGYTQ